MDTNMYGNQEGAESPIVSPDQTDMFAPPAGDENVTRIDIDHMEGTIYNLEDTGGNPNDPTAQEEGDHNNVTRVTQIKVLAALAIVGVAGYVAYWVQEPVQLQADVLNGAAANEAGATGAAATPADAVSGESKNIDVSLFGFEPAVVKIDKGTTVVWTNTSTEDQTLIGSSQDGQSFTSPVLTSGKTYSFKFDQDAAFTYYSTYNPALKATITVGTGSLAVAAAEAPATDAAVVVPAAPATPDSTLESVAPVTADSLFGSAPETESLATPAASLTEAKNLATASTPDSSLTDAAKATQSPTELKGAAPSKLAKTGPVEDLYVVMLLVIAWLNRRKLANIFR